MDNKQLIITMTGRLDAETSASFEEEVFDAFSKNPAETVILDAEDLSYISSTGLRVLLKLKKEISADFRIINVCQDVYEIFAMTGFTQMFPITKAFRHLSVEGCKKIGHGAKAIVYRYDPETVIKVYESSCTLEYVRNALEMSRKIFVLGLPTAIPYDVVRVDDSFGAVYELIDAEDFASVLAREPGKMEELADIYTELLLQIHHTQANPGTNADEYPPMKERVLSWIRDVREVLPREEADRLEKMVSEVPETHTMIHGDYHMKNVMLQKGEPLLIDLDTIASGHPIFELSCIFLSYIGFRRLEKESSRDFFGLSAEQCEAFFRLFLRKYFPDRDEAGLEEIWNKAGILGMIKLLRWLVRHVDTSSGDGKKKISSCLGTISEMLAKTETLAF